MLLAATLLGGCIAFVPHPGEEMTPLPVPDHASPVPIRFGDVAVRLRRGTEIGRYVFAADCRPPYNILTWGQNRALLDRTAFKDAFHEELTEVGYRIRENPRRMFDLDAERQSAEYIVSAQIVDLRMTLCRHFFWLTGTPLGIAGGGWARVDWTVYSRLERKVLYRTSSEGSSTLDRATVDGDVLIVENAFAAAARNLAADPGFHALVVGRAAETVTPMAQPHALSAAMIGTAEIPAADDTGRGGGRPITVRSTPRTTLTAPEIIDDILAATVVIGGGAGHGSGFVVDPDGLILTNAHVVGEADRVRVTRHDGSAVIGVVDRREPFRDVALVRIAGNSYPTLPIRRTRARIGEPVYVVGAPMQEYLRNTVTQGIVSAHRPPTPSRPAMIQADASIQEGNSGGPLLDIHGNVIGITVAAHVGAGGQTLGLNLFIPIEEAVRALNMEVDDTGAEDRSDIR